MRLASCFVISAALLIGASASSAQALTANSRAQFAICQPGCGQEQKSQGWRETLRCEDGHTWSYLVEKGGETKRCSGINALAGPSEGSCAPFTGSRRAFAADANEAKIYLQQYNEASRAGALDAFLNKRIADHATPANCSTAGDAAKPEKRS